MKRWQFTLLLVGLAAVAAITAPLLRSVRLPAAADPPGVSSLGAPSVFVGSVAVRDVVVVLDASGSMSAASKMDDARRAVRALHEALLPDEDFAVVAFNDRAVPVVPPDVERSEVDALLESVLVYGGTNLYAGLELGAATLERMRSADEPGHLVVVSDGVANVGVVDDAALERLAGQLGRRGVTISTIGIAPGADAAALERLARASGGESAVVRDAARLLDVLPALHRGAEARVPPPSAQDHEMAAPTVEELTSGHVR